MIDWLIFNMHLRLRIYTSKFVVLKTIERMLWKYVTIVDQKLLLLSCYGIYSMRVVVKMALHTAYGSQLDDGRRSSR